MKTRKTNSGILLASEERSASEQPAVSDYPIRQGWFCSKIGLRFHEASNEDFRRNALESLYIAADPGGGRVYTPEQQTQRDRTIDLINQLAVELVGGIPEGFDEYT